MVCFFPLFCTLLVVVGWAQAAHAQIQERPAVLVVGVAGKPPARLLTSLGIVTKQAPWTWARFVVASQFSWLRWLGFTGKNARIAVAGQWVAYVQEAVSFHPFLSLPSSHVVRELIWCTCRWQGLTGWAGFSAPGRYPPSYPRRKAAGWIVLSKL